MFLEACKLDALTILGTRPTFEARNGAGSQYIGLGYAVAKGWATYQGGYEFKITAEGEKALAEYRADAE